jgi:oxalate decarboxylase
MRELHWHPNSDELQYHIAGDSRMTVFASGATAATFDYQPGDVAYVPRNMAHDIENTGASLLRYLEVWKSSKFSDVSLRQWLAFTPSPVFQAISTLGPSLSCSRRRRNPFAIADQLRTPCSEAGSAPWHFLSDGNWPIERRCPDRC